MFLKQKIVFLQIFLVFLFVISMNSSVLAATNLHKSIQNGQQVNHNNDNSNTKKKPTRVRELIEKRTANSSHYLMSDGSQQAVISLDPQHYKDSKGNWMDIVPKLIDEADINDSMTTVSKEISGEVEQIKERNKQLIKHHSFNRKDTYYRALQVPYDVKIPKLYRQGYSVGKGKDKLYFKPVGTIGKSRGKPINNQTIQYDNVWESTDVTLELLSDGLKESLIIKDAEAPKTFSFEVKGKLKDGLTTDNLTIVPAILTDAKGKIEPVKQVLRKKGNKQFIDLTIDTTGLTYPINVDPTVKELTLTDDAELFHFNSGNLTDLVSFPNDSYLIGARFDSAGGLYSALLKFDFSSIKTSTVTSAKLILYRSDENLATTPLNIEAHMLNSAWSHKDYLIKPQLGDLISSIYTAVSYNAPNIQEFTNMEKYVNYVLSGNSNYGIELLASGFSTLFQSREFYSMDTTQTQYQPKLIITYNAKPTIEKIINPTTNANFSKDNHTFAPSIQVSGTGQLTASYYVDSETTPRDSQTVTNADTTQTVSFNAMDIGALSEGKHTFQFKVSNGQDVAQQSVDVYVDKTAPSLQTINFTSTDKSINIAGSAADSLSGLAAVPYLYTVGTSSSGWTTQTTYTQSGLTPNSSYAASFEAKDNVGLLTNKTRNIYTKAQTPSVQVSGSTENRLGISIHDNNPSTTPYEIQMGSMYVNATGTLIASPTWIALSNKQITVTGLSANTGYSIAAKAKNGAGVETAWSAKVTGTTLALPPSPVNTKSLQQSITVSWPAISGALSYDIEADGNVIPNGTATTYTQSGLLPNTTHTYRIRVKNAAGLSNWSQRKTTMTLPNPPAIPSGLKGIPSQTQVSLSWDAVAKADSYDIEVDGTIVNTGLNTTYVHTGLSPETQHTYRVRARNTGGTSNWSSAVSTTTLPYPPKTPTHVVGKQTIYTVTVNWDQMDRATGYEIEVDGLIIDNGNNVSYTQQGLDPLSGHTYRVRAKNIGGKSPWSDPLDVTTYPEKPPTPANIFATADESSITLTWYQVATAESYDVEIDGTKVVTVKNPQFVDAGLTPDSLHTFRIRAKNISGDSNWSNIVKMNTFPASTSGGSSPSTTSLTNVVAIVTNSYITLSWDAVAQNVEYDIEVDGKLINNGSDTIYHHTGLNPNEYHTYKIRVRDKNGTSDWIAILSLATLPNPPDAPGNINAIVTNSSIELKWEKVNGATGFDIEVDGKTIDAGTTQDYIDNNLTSGTSHTYRIRAKNITGVTAWSKALVASTTSPSYTVAVQQNQPISFSLLATNVQDFSDKKFVVTYDPTQLDVTDLNDFTLQKDKMSEGDIPGTDLHVVYTPGKIIFTVNKNIIPGTSWSGEITTIQFLSKVNGQANLDFKVE